MAYLFDTIAEFDEEITYVRAQMRNAIGAEEFKLNTSQSNQQVRMNMSEIRKYLNELTTGRVALAQRLSGQGVTSIIVRRDF